MESNKTNKKKKQKKVKKVKIKRHKSFKAKINNMIDEGKLKPKKVYPKERCKYMKADGTRCRRNAIGSGQLCKMHGGERDRNNTIKEYSTEFHLIKKTLNMVKTYDPEKHPRQMIELSKLGMSEVEIASTFGVGVKTLQKWAEDFEVFSMAYDVAMANHETWWLEKGKEGLDNPREFNTPLYKFLTMNKVGYSDKMESRNFNVSAGVLVVPKTKSLEEWEGECVEYIPEGASEENKK